MNSLPQNVTITGFYRVCQPRRTRHVTFLQTALPSIASLISVHFDKATISFGWVGGWVGAGGCGWVVGCRWVVGWVLVGGWVVFLWRRWTFFRAKPEKMWSMSQMRSTNEADQMKKKKMKKKKTGMSFLLLLLLLLLLFSKSRARHTHTPEFLLLEIHFFSFFFVC